MDLSNTKNTANPIALWTWNEKLNTEDTLLCADRIINCGFGGVCIKAGFGLQNKYMGEEWMRNINEASTRINSQNSKVWISDDNGNYSGCANGTVNSFGLDMQQKTLRFESGERTNDRTVIFKDGYHFYYDVNPYYVDVLNPDVSQEFIKSAYTPYVERFSENIDVFLCSNPQLFSNSIPWSFSLPAEYKNAYGEELLDVLIELFRPVGNYINTRIKFWSLVNRLFAENFLKPIYDYCNDNNIQLALNFSSGNPAQYDYSHIPCVESYSKNDSSGIETLIASSHAQQFGKKESYAIIFSNAGYGSSFDDFKRIAQQHMARGITGIISSGENPSLRGGRKYTNPSSTLFCSSDYDGYMKANNYISRLGDILSQGNADFETLVIYNASLNWPNFDTENNDSPDILSVNIKNTVNTLENKHIPFHIADELTLQKHAHIDGDVFVVGKQRYKTVILSPDCEFLESTTKLLSEFELGGGFITTADSLHRNDICDNEKLLYTYRNFSEHKIHYFFNNSPQEFTAAISVADKMIDLTTTEILPFYGIYKFAPYEGIILIDDGSAQLSRPFKKPLKTLDISGDWYVDKIDNVLMLDKCDVYFDGSLFAEDENCSDVIEIATSLKKPLQIDCVYKFNISQLPQELFLACENSDLFTISINDVVIDKKYDGFFINKYISRINVSEYISPGENTISIRTFYSPTEEFLLSYEKASESSSELNNLNYSLEISPIYIVGDFSVVCNGDFRRLDKNAFRYIGNFSIGEKPEKYSLSNLHSQGLVFFAGSLSFSKTINLSDTSYCIKFNPVGINSVTVEVNGKIADNLLWQPFQCNISEFLVKGDNEIKITINSTLRNLLGPHHIPMGELYEVHPGNFHKSPCVWNSNKSTPWENNYCFIEFGINTLE